MKKLKIILFIILPLFSSYVPQVTSAEKNNVLKIGVASMTTPVDTVKYYQEIIDYIGEQIKQPVQMVHKRTYEEMDLLLEKGEVKVAFVCSASYVMDHDKFGLELLVVPSVYGKTEYHSYIIVNKDSPLKSFPELKRKTFVFTDPRSNSGKLYPTYLLKTTTGLLPENFFKKITYSYSHNKSIELVAKGIADGASVESLVYEYMVKKNSPYVKQTKIIQRSPPFGIPPVVVTKDIDVNLKKNIKDAFLNLHGTERGRTILSAMMIDSFVQISDNAYDSIREMYRFVGNTPVIAKDAKGKQVINFGVIPRDNPRLLYEKYQPLLDYLSEKTPYAFELILKRNYEDTIDAVGNGEMDIAILGPLTYLEARAKYGAMCILKPKGINGNAIYKSVIIKRKDSAINSLSELRGKRMAFSASKSTSGNLMPRYLLAQSGIHLNDLGSFANFDYHDSVVKAVLKEQYDAGAVRDSVAKKYSKLGIEVIAESEDTPIGPLVVGPKTAFSVTENIKKALLELNPNNADHQKILKRLEDDLKNGFIEAFDGDYADIRAKINAVPQTCGRSCHPKIKL